MLTWRLRDDGDGLLVVEAAGGEGGGPELGPGDQSELRTAVT